MKNKESKIKKPFYKRWWFVVLVIVVALWFIGSLGSDDTKEVSSINEETNMQGTDSDPQKTEDDRKKNEQETKAQKLQDDAKAEFEKANYAKYLEKINKILNDFPETNVASSIGDFSQQMTDSVIKVSSVELAQEYKDNEVRADGIYDDKLVIVTGKIDNIGKSAGNVYITLSDGEQYSFASVQCMFKNEDEINKVAELEKGNEITLIGKCTGQTITNVMISDSYILK